MLILYMYSYGLIYFTFVKTEKLEGKNKWIKVFKNEPSKICGRQRLKI